MKVRIPGLPLLLLALALVGSACAPQGFQPRGWSGVTAVGSPSPLLLVADGRGYLLALEPQGGGERWRYPQGEEPLGPLYASPALADGGIVVVGTYGGNGARGTVHAVRLEDGTPLWQRETEGPIVGQAGVAPGRVLVPSSDGWVYALRASDGALLWRFRTGSKVWSTPVERDGLVYFGSLDHNLYAVDLETGEEVWRFRTEGAIVGRPLLVRDLVVVGSLDRRLYGVDARTGEERWRFQGANWFWAGPASDGERIYAGDLDGNLYALDLRGRLEWRARVEAPVVAEPVPLPDGVAVATEAGDFIVLTADGVRRWTYSLRTPVRARPAVQGGKAFVVTVEGEVVALHVERGTRLWTATLPK